MDPIIRYLNHFLHSRSQDIQEGTKFLIDTYKIVIERKELKTWRFSQGKKRVHDFQPMYCAFSATPFLQNDWFILRLVKAKSDQNRAQVSIGFCLDYGVQEEHNAPNHPVTQRRKEIRQRIEELKEEKTHLLKSTIPFPTSHYQPHAYKGFEWEFERPHTSEELADLFIATVLEWEKLFRLL